jgi:hypothetical protein
MNPGAVTFRGLLGFGGKPSITMKTVLSLVTPLALIIAAIALDTQRLNAGVLFSALAVAALFAFALHDGRRPVYQVPSARLARFPAPTRYSLPRRSRPLDLAA